jgi:hypothetical protein
MIEMICATSNTNQSLSCKLTPLALTLWAAFGSLSSLRSDSLYRVILSKNPFSGSIRRVSATENLTLKT